MLYQDERYNKEFTGQTSTQFKDIIPRAKGMNFLYFIELDISKIDYDGSAEDLARKEGAIVQNAEGFADMLRKGKYKPLNYEPPVVMKDEKTGMYICDNGRTRYNGHKLAKKGKIFVAVVEFVEYDNLPGNYWAGVYASTSNAEETEDYIKSARTTADISFSASKLIEENNLLIDLTPTGKAQKTDENTAIIWNVLQDLKVRDKKNYWVECVYAEIGKGETIKVYQRHELPTAPTNIQPNIVLSTPTKLQAVDNTIYYVAKFNGVGGKSIGSDRDYDPRVYDIIMDMRTSNPTTNVCLICHYDKVSTTQLDVLREYKTNHMFVDQTNKNIDNTNMLKGQNEEHVDNEHFEWLDIVHLPQKTKSESKNEFVRI
jgi:hypothetical protein